MLFVFLNSALNWVKCLDRSNVYELCAFVIFYIQTYLSLNCIFKKKVITHHFFPFQRCICNRLIKETSSISKSCNPNLIRILDQSLQQLKIEQLDPKSVVFSIDPGTQLQIMRFQIDSRLYLLDRHMCFLFRSTFVFQCISLSFFVLIDICVSICFLCLVVRFSCSVYLSISYTNRFVFGLLFDFVFNFFNISCTYCSICSSIFLKHLLLQWGFH